jgi:hypothetical protein
MEEKMFIGRTIAYYEENDSCFCERTWVVSDNPYDEQFADNVYEMSEDAINEYEWWANCRLKNEWELSYTFNPDMRCSEAIFDSIVKKSKIYEI